MTSRSRITRMLQFCTKVCIAVGAGGFWGLVFAQILQRVFDVDGDDAFLYGTLPVTLLFVVLVWTRLPKALGFDADRGSS